MTSTSETAFRQPTETVYDFVTNPGNWTRTYPAAKIDACHATLARELGEH